MIDTNDWQTLKRLFGATFRNTLHFSIGSLGVGGDPIVTPVGSVLLHEPGHASYFELYAHGLGQRVSKDPRISVLAVDSGRWLWLNALWRGRFARLPAIRLVGRADGAVRPPSDSERQRMLKRIRGVRHLKGGRAVWHDFDCPVRDLWIDRIDGINLGALSVPLSAPVSQS